MEVKLNDLGEIWVRFSLKSQALLPRETAQDLLILLVVDFSLGHCPSMRNKPPTFISRTFSFHCRAKTAICKQNVVSSRDPDLIRMEGGGGRLSREECVEISSVRRLDLLKSTMSERNRQWLSQSDSISDVLP